MRLGLEKVFVLRSLRNNQIPLWHYRNKTHFEFVAVEVDDKHLTLRANLPLDGFTRAEKLTLRFQFLKLTLTLEGKVVSVDGRFLELEPSPKIERAFERYYERLALPANMRVTVSLASEPNVPINIVPMNLSASGLCFPLPPSAARLIQDAASAASPVFTITTKVDNVPRSMIFTGKIVRAAKEDNVIILGGAWRGAALEDTRFFFETFYNRQISDADAGRLGIEGI